MNLKKITLKNAGPFASAEFSLTSPITFLVGDNESGKSTLREWVTGLFFGFARQKQLRSGLIRWGEKEAEISSVLLLEGEEQVTVRRTIRESNATCRIDSLHGVQEIGDAPLPYLGEMDRAMYTGVYSLRVEDLKFPDASAWNALQHQLLSGEVLSFLRPVSEVSAQWKEQALHLWRPDRRGNPVLSERYARRDELLRQLEEARQRQQVLFDLTREEGDVTSALEKDAAETVQLEAFLKEAYSKRSLIEQLERYERLLVQAGDLRVFAELPRDVQERYRQLQKDAHDTQAALLEAEKEQEESARAMSAFGEQEEALLAHKEAIRALAGGRSQFAHDENDLLLKQAEAAMNQSQYRSLAKTILIDPQGAEASVAEISPAELAQAASRYGKAMQETERAREALDRLEVESAGTKTPLLAMIPAGVLLTVSILLLAFPELVPANMKGILSAGLMAASAILFALAVGFSLPRKKGQLQRQQEKCEAAEAELAEAKKELTEALQGLHLTQTLWDNPSELLRQIESLSQRLEAVGNSAALANDVRVRHDRYELEAMRLAGLLLMDPPADALGACDALTAALERAMSRKEAAELNGKNHRNLTERVRRLKELEAAAMVQMLNFKKALSELPGAGLQDQIEELIRRRALGDKAQALRDEVYERTGYDLSTLRQTLQDAQWPWHEDAIAQAEETSREIRERRELLHTRLGALREERKMLSDQPLPSDIESVLRKEDEEIRQLLFERDQIAVAFGLLRLGEEAWRREHQPELIRRAGDYLSRITHGKYTRLFLPEGGDTLWVYHEKSETYLDPIQKRLSKGTLEQIYLALRLSMLDQLDPPGMPLPLLLDETLVNWDDKRMSGLMEVLHYVSRKRQVLFFTCHPQTAEIWGSPEQVIVLEDAHG